MAYVIGLDIGIKNLGVCVYDFRSHKVVHWSVDSLVPKGKHRPRDNVRYVTDWVSHNRHWFDNAFALVIEQQMRVNMRIIAAVIDDKGRWDERYKEGGNNHSRLFQRIVNSSIVHLDYLHNDAYAALGFEAHKYYFVKEGLDQSGWWGFSLGATEDITLPQGGVIAAGTIMRIPESTGGGAFARLTHVYGCYWAGTAEGIKWGQKNPNEKGLTRNDVYVGHEPINMRVYDGRDAPESKLYIRPIYDQWTDSEMNWANGLSKVKELWLNSGFSQLSDFDFVVKGTYGDGTGNTSD